MFRTNTVTRRHQDGDWKEEIKGSYIGLIPLTTTVLYGCYFKGGWPKSCNCHVPNLELAGVETRGPGLVPLKYIEYGVHEDLIKTYPEPYSIYLRGTIGFRV